MRFLPLLLLLAACSEIDYRPSSVGPDAEVQVVMDSTLWAGAVGEAVRATVGGPIVTLPNREAAYALRYHPLRTQRSREDVQGFKNLLIAADLSDTSATASRYARSFFSADALQAVQADTAGVVIMRNDLFRQNQRVILVGARSSEALAQTLRTRGGEITNLFNDAARARTATDIFEKMRQTAFEDTMLAERGYTFGVPVDYFVARDTTDFLWMRRVLTDTWRSFFVYDRKNATPSLLDSAYVVALRDSLTSTHIEGTEGGYVRIDHRLPVRVREVNLNGRYALEIRGVWVLVQPSPDGTREWPVMAGPFVSYATYDETTQRFFLLDGMVFAPGPRNSRRDFLRQMEAIAHTFRTASDAPAAAPAP